MPLPNSPQTQHQLQNPASARPGPQRDGPTIELLPPALPQAGGGALALSLDDPFGSALDCIGSLETAVIARLRSYESELCLLKANAEKSVNESTKLARRLVEVTNALNRKATTVASAQQKLDAMLVSLIEEAQAEKPRSEDAAPVEVAAAAQPSVPKDWADTADWMQAEIDSQARQIELLEEQLKTGQTAAQRKIDELEAELQRERLQHALAGDRSFGRAA